MDKDNAKVLSFIEKEAKMLEERKMIEESDNKLTEELFGVINNSIKKNIPSIKIIPPIKAPKILKIINNNNNNNNNNTYRSNKIKRKQIIYDDDDYKDYDIYYNIEDKLLK